MWIQCLGNNAGSDALHVVPAGLSSRQHGGLHRLNDKTLHVFDLLFNGFTCARSCTSGSASDNQRVESAADDMEDLASGRFPMDLRIRRISELLRHKVEIGRASCREGG